MIKLRSASCKNAITRYQLSVEISIDTYLCSVDNYHKINEYTLKLYAAISQMTNKTSIVNSIRGLAGYDQLTSFI